MKMCLYSSFYFLEVLLKRNDITSFNRINITDKLTIPICFTYICTFYLIYIHKIFNMIMKYVGNKKEKDKNI